uniref:Receptor-like protein 12 n=2 Tax=Aegilops tauschii TaxID=37682 RepID=A0A453DTU9_AEGTS
MDMDGEGNNSPSIYIPRVTWLELASCGLTGFPSSLAHLNQMSYLDLSCNRISGAIPKWIWATWSSSLTYLNLSHNMLSSMQLNSYVLPFDRLEVLDLSSNQLQGQIPMPCPPATILDYSNNSFSSLLPNFTLYLGNKFSISRNKISGHIPNTVCDSTINVLDLSFNNFSGRIPCCLIEDGCTSVLSLRENHFEGVLPNNIKGQCMLQTLDLNGNKIEGQLPTTLTKCLQLELLDVGNNDMVGTFPSWLGLLPELRILILRSNRFYGSVGGDLHSSDKSGEYFSRLQILDVASNNFSGNLSLDWFEGLKSMMVELNTTGYVISASNGSSGDPYQDTVTVYYKSIYRTFDKILTTFTAIDLSNNSFDGTIPGSLGRLISLHVLNMSGNAFTGDIPQEFGGMTQLESLDLSQNQLSGEIPEALTNLTFLGILNLCNNQLVGRIPRSGQFFGTFQNSSFEGNLGLCGPPLSNPCDIPPLLQVRRMGRSPLMFLFVGLGFGIGFAAAILMRWGQIGKWFVKSARALRT